MKPLSIQVIQAQPGYFTVIDFDDTKEVELGEPVIAWRIETFNIKDREELFSTCMPLTVDGDIVSNCIGVQNPDMTVTVFEEASYKNLEDLRQTRYPKK